MFITHTIFSHIVLANIIFIINIITLNNNYSILYTQRKARWLTAIKHAMLRSTYIIHEYALTRGVN